MGKDDPSLPLVPTLPCAPHADLFHNVVVRWEAAPNGHISWKTLPGSLLEARMTAFWPNSVIPFPHPKTGYGRELKPWAVKLPDAKSGTTLSQFASVAKSPRRYNWGASIFILRITNHLTGLYKGCSVNTNCPSECQRCLSFVIALPKTKPTTSNHIYKGPPVPLLT
jgi:hypothetical protein